MRITMMTGYGDIAGDTRLRIVPEIMMKQQLLMVIEIVKMTTRAKVVMVADRYL